MTNQIIQHSDFVIKLFVIIDDFLKLINRFQLETDKNANKGRKPIHRVSLLFPPIISLLNFLAIGKSKSLFYLDSTPIEVCNIKRASSNKVCKFIASRKKSTMGWFYGLKMHAICNHKNQIVAIHITTGSADDREPVQELVKNLQGTIYADAGYIGEELRKTLASSGIKLMAAPRNNMKKLMTFIQYSMLKSRQKIEDNSLPSSDF